MRATYDTVSRKLSWSGTQGGLSSKITHIDFHGPASPAKAAGVVQPIKSLSGGSTTLSEAEAADLIGGYWNITIHTRSHPEGEIRGQVVRGEYPSITQPPASEIGGRLDLDRWRGRGLQ